MKQQFTLLNQYIRRQTIPVKVGNIEIGGKAPIRVQSMTNTDTNDVEASVEQSIRIINAGGELVRLTAQGTREAANLELIRKELTERGYNSPLVADIHFVAQAAFEAAKHVEKVRINPGNFADAAKRFKQIEYTEIEYISELANIRYKFVPFLALCKKNGIAIRIGVNHGSLSDRVMSRYGDTAEGMVESCMEYLRIAREMDFDDVVISIKASNTRVMVHTVRLLITTMLHEDMHYPLHLGVTEAGDGEDGRIKSAVGIGALLADGIGDTIRVSLSEDPELEIPVALQLVNYMKERENHLPIPSFDTTFFSPFSYHKTATTAVNDIGGSNMPVVVGDSINDEDIQPDYVAGKLCLFSTKSTNRTPMVTQVREPGAKQFLVLRDVDVDNLDPLQVGSDTVVILHTNNANVHAALRSARLRLYSKGCRQPVIFKLTYTDADASTFALKAATDAGNLFLDGLGDGLWLVNTNLNQRLVVNTSFGILQASRVRMTKTEFISCPGCGRTLFNLQETIKNIKQRTSHLKGLKIGIMGCIVNGPGEMADADYGYVGAGKGRVSLYKGQECVERNIRAEEAVEKLIQLIKENNDWVEPE
jgi:(E)-4-hydroxy-3-methylbut-2-enyl-diphosphate synthase